MNVKFESVIRMTLAALVGSLCGAARLSADEPNNPLRRSSESFAQRVTLASHEEMADEPAAPAPPRVASRASSPEASRVQPVRYGFSSNRHRTPGYVPRHEMMNGYRSLGQIDEPLPAQPVPVEVPYEDEMFWDEGHSIDGCCGGTGCNDCLLRCPNLSLDHVEFMAGVNGFTGPPNRGESGSFGFYEGVNWAAPLPCNDRGLGGQLGFRAVQSNLSGTEFTNDNRYQYFVTGGIFRRVDWGLQGGVVLDYLGSNWYYSTDLTQVRGEVSWVYPYSHELGFWFTSSLKSRTAETRTLNTGVPQVGTATFEGQDLYAFFYRRRFDDCAATGRLYAGFTGESDGLVGADFYVPLLENLALQSTFTYLIPDDNEALDHVEEAWNVGVGLVFFPGCRTARSSDYYRPLLNVADNGSFILNRF